MTDLSTIFSFFYELGIYSWKDVIEITTLAITFYQITAWLKKDNSQLLDYFYFYCLLFIFAYHMELATLSRLLFICSPIAAMLFILSHQKTLQQHFISLKRRYKPSKHDWTSALLQTTLMAMNKNRSLICVIERGQSLEDYINTPALIDGHIDEYFLETLLESPKFNESKLLWCNQKGNILGFNAEWLEHNDQLWIHEEISQEHRWKQEALFYTTKTDCLVFMLHPASRCYDVVFNGNIAENITAAQLANLLETSCSINPKKIKKSVALKDFHDIPFKKSYQKQQLQ